jgi:hypothetical protein
MHLPPSNLILRTRYSQVTDSSEDKKWAKRKFVQDIDSTKTENMTLWGFVFFTNVDLTPAEITELEKYGLSVGLSFVEIFYRERLRITLDSPRGLALRYQYLNISLSDAEQQAFFAEYGSQIENLLHKGFGVIDDKLKRIEFLHDCLKPLMGGSVTLTLKQECTPEDLGHFRFMAQILNLHEPEPHPALWIAGAPAEHFVPLEVPPLFDWPEPLSQTEVQVPWVTITLKIQNPPAWMNPELARKGWGLDFSMFTPEKTA